jgi:hypothetical protein
VIAAALVLELRRDLVCLGWNVGHEQVLLCQVLEIINVGHPDHVRQGAARLELRLELADYDLRPRPVDVEADPRVALLEVQLHLVDLVQGL